MHILLTDILVCPRCAPGSGLIVRSDAIHERRVLEGALGCPSCHTQYPIREGIARLTAADSSGPGVDSAAVSRSAVGPDEAVRIAALLGATEPLGMLLLIGPVTRHATALADLVRDTEIIAATAGAPADAAPGTSRITIGARLPFFAGRLRAIWASGAHADALLEECARTLHPLGRLVLEPAPADAAARLEAVGLRIAARQDATVLAVRRTGPQIASGREPSLS